MTVEKIKYRYEEPKKWFEHLSGCFPSTLNGKYLYLKKPFGEGELCYSEIQEGLWVQRFNYRVFKPLLMHTEDTSSNDFFLMNFYLSENSFVRTYKDGKKVNHNFHHASILFTSSMVSADISPESNKWMDLVQILFTKDWFRKQVDLENYQLHDVFMDESPICFSENLNSYLRNLVDKSMLPTTHKLTLASNVYQILDYILLKFQKRDHSVKNKKLHPGDIRKLLKVKSYLDENVTKDISLKTLSGISQMSASKFKRLFVQVFGMPPYRYHLENKLEKGKELIETKGFTISETAFFLGYEDHGSFTRAFKKQYGIVPSAL